MNKIYRGPIQLLGVLVVAGALSFSHAADSTQPRPSVAASAPSDEVAFMGVRTTARRVVFICDASGSMMESFDVVRTRLRRTMEAMQLPQCLNVVFLKEHAPAPIDKNLLPATPENKYKLIKYLDDEYPEYATDPDPAIKTAFSMRPDVIYLFCDPSCFPNPNGTIKLCRDLNSRKKVRIMTIAYGNGQEGQEALKQIAADSGGQFRVLESKDLED